MFASVCRYFSDDYMTVSLAEIARVCWRLREFIGKCWVCLSLHQCFTEYAGVCQRFNAFAGVCQILPEFSRVCQSSLVYTGDCQCFPLFAAVLYDSAFDRDCLGLLVFAIVYWLLLGLTEFTRVFVGVCLC